MPTSKNDSLSGSTSNNKKSRVEYLIKTGIGLLQIGNFEDAIECFRKANKIKKSRLIFSLLGSCYFDMMDLDRAIDCCNQALEMEEDGVLANGNILNDKACYLLESGNTEEAIQFFQAAIEDKKFLLSHISYSNLGKINEKLGKWKEAIQCYKKAFEVQPMFESAIESYYKIISMLN